MAEKKQGKGLTTEEIFNECRKHSTEDRQQICEEFISDVETVSDRMKDLFDCNPGVLMMYGVTVEVKVTLFNEPAYEMKLGNADFYAHVMKTAKKAEERDNDKRA